MKRQFLFLFLALLLIGILPMQSALAQADGDFRSAATGNWADLTTWEQYSSSTSTWSTPTVLPVYNDGHAITIKSGHTVTYTSAVATANSSAIYVKRCVIESGATVIIASGVMWIYNDGSLPNLTINGTLTNNYQVKMHSSTTGESILIGDGGVFNSNKYAWGSGFVPISGGTGYIATQGTGTFYTKVGTSAVTITVGTPTTYAPVTVTAAASDTLGFNVVRDTTGTNSGADRVQVLWNVNAFHTTYTPAFQWPQTAEGTNFTANRDSVKLYNGSNLVSAALSGTNPYVLTAGSAQASGSSSYSIITPVKVSGTGDYRSAASGNWADLSTWEQYSSSTGTWVTPTTLPTYNDGHTVTIKSGHTVTFTSDVATANADAQYVKRCVIESGATVVVASGAMWIYNDGSLPNLTINGTLTNNAQVKLHSSTSGEAVLIANGGVFTSTAYTWGNGIVPGGSGYIATAGTGLLTTAVDASAASTVAIGTATASAPVTVTPTAGATMSFNVVRDTAGCDSGSDRVALKWTMKSDQPYTPAFQWPSASEGTNFAANRSTYANLYKGTALTGASLSGTDPYVLTASSSQAADSASYMVGIVPDGDYKSVVSGSWSDLSTWKQYCSIASAWVTPASLPVYNDGHAIEIAAGDTVTFSGTVASTNSNAQYVKRCTVDSTATLVITGTMWLYDDGSGIPCLTINGTCTNNYQFKFHETTDMVVIGNGGSITCKYAMGSGIVGPTAGFSSSGYIKMNGTGVLTIPVSAATTTFPLGTSAAYAPLTLTPDASSTFSFNVAKDTTGSNSGADRVQLLWAVTSTANYTATFQWPSSAEGTNFSTNRSSYAQLYNISLWSNAAGTLAGSDPYTFTSTSSLAGTATYGIGNGILALGGTVTGPVTSANWLLRVDSTNATPIATGSISANDQLVKGLIIQGYTGTTQTAPGVTTNITTSQRMYPTSSTVGYWPADSVAGNTVVQQKADRYVQYTAAPYTGTNFIVSKISMCLGDNIGNFKTSVNVWYYVGTDTTDFLTKATKINSSPVYSIGTSTVYQSPIFTLSTPVTVPSGSKIFVRVYPMYAVGASSGKYWQISNVTISGTTNPAIAALAPTATTVNASSISTTFFTTGGKVIADGGGTVTARGVCWDTASGATISKNHTTDSSGTGAFTSTATGLTAATKYYVRAYATNSAGTSYGNEITVTTYAAIVVPTVTTNTVTSITVHTALSGGKISDWGGADITAKGICWSTSANPTISDNYSVDGTGTAAFTRSMSGLSATTTYHVRAYATNSAGTGYGGDTVFTTLTPAKDSTVVVAKDGSGDYTRVCDALRKVPASYTGKWTIFVKKGIYFERDTLLATSYNVNLVGEDRDSTIITNWIYSDYNGAGSPGTNGTYTFLVLGYDFIAKNITIQNTYWPNRWGTTVAGGTQAVALMTNGGDRHEFINCALRGYQDTYYAGGSSATAYGRAYFKNCIITGTVDYIFGRGVCVFDSCTTLTMSNAGTSITASSTESTAKYGLVFRNCNLTVDTATFSDSCGYAHVPITAFYLGRPWQGSPRAVYIHCNEPASLAAIGWTTMSTTPALFAEYTCYGPGASTSRGTVSGWTVQPSQLTDAEAANYSLATIFAKNSSSSTNITYDWMPTNASASDDLPFTTGVVDQPAANLAPKKMTIANYPNPFNPETNIQFTVAATGKTTVKIYNVLGQEIARVFEGQATAGQTYKVTFNGTRAASGVYFCSIESNGHRLVSRMLLLK